MGAEAPPEPAIAAGTALFVRRPILAFVINALIVIAGLGALMGVEVRELPDVDRPVITVSTDLPGAAPQTVDREITATIEGAAGRVAGVKSISSSSHFGRSQVTVEFDGATNLDAAASDMRDAISRVQNRLPEASDPPRIVKADADAGAVMRIGVTSARRTAPELTRLVNDVIADRLVAVPGVADVQTYGDRDEIFRVDLDLRQLASRGLTLADVRRALANANLDVPAGALSSASQTLTVRSVASVATTRAFEDLVLRKGVLLGDVATVTLGPAPGSAVLRANGQTGIGLGIIRQAQSNTLEISAGVHRAVAAQQRLMPPDVKIFVTSDDARFINGAIREVVRSLVLACLIVVAVIYVFLRDWRATLIPALTLPVALIGTVAAVYLVGFSINILTLLALVLATGMVVDDAIVVLENIVRRRAEGMGPRAAAVLGTNQVLFAVLATTTTLAAVFVPISFLPGQTGGLFREFGFTLAMAVLLSSVVALTLTPVLASRLLRGGDGDGGGGGRGPGPVARLGTALARAYAATLRWALAGPFVVLLAVALFAVTAVLVSGGIQRELTPREDRAVLLMAISAPQGVALEYTASKMREIEDRVEVLREEGLVTNVFSIAGRRGQGSSGFLVMTLTDWAARDVSQNDIARRVHALTQGIVGLRMFTIQPNSLRIRGGGSGLRFAITGTDYDRLAGLARTMVSRLEADPRFGRVQLGYETTQPQLVIQIDRRRASDLGVDINGLGDALQSVLQGARVTSVYLNDRAYGVDMVSTAEPVNDPGDLEHIFVKAGDGTMVPLSSFVTLHERAVAPELDRESQMRAVSISAGLTPGFGLGKAWAAAQDIAAGTLPAGNHLLPLAETATLDETNSGLVAVFAAAVAVVLLVLAAQFESFLSAVIVMATVPLGLACAVFALLLTGGSLNVYSQIGLVLLVGIMAKNGILIVEFANQLRDRGEAVADAIYHAATIRLRPVMMTMVSTVLGGVPLILSEGAGAEARQALGWIIVGGLGLATLATLYVTPVAYLLLARFSRPRAQEQARLLQELRQASRL
ncbi:multidrug transporter AcrB [Defluviimonas sp. 20V17]|uniref:Hydrophobic/amphiphilic exporter-1, HAE1 family n=1 Tax=Allgaiera indica TaxID=765699 RepID=A0AAN5A0P1_9RHOB|nr:efflux RND transporter permease subunit [Allgaiera indica]KDB05488.1 multidrug transporter AcrB [Defluviimonas sp. 20V17]GHE04614.1 multidrug transporter AcrB [Allgaiera indica]SDX48228.1 hydrophobic/amphiphilic exporter-1, HAE1 family [Allgaiera indica]